MTTVHYVWDSIEDNIVRELDGTGAAVADYTTEPEHFGNVISQRRGGQRFFHYDGLGSTLAVTDESQNVTDIKRYRAFGEITASSGTTVLPFQYVGQKGYYSEQLTGQFLIRRRSYETAHGRFLSRDPLPMIPPSNLETTASSRDRFGWLNDIYAYGVNSPTNHTDPSGLSVPIDQYLPFSHPGFIVYKDRCRQTLSNIIIVRPQKKGDLSPEILMKVSIGGFPGGDCNEGTKTHVVSVILYETIPIGAFGPGAPGAPISTPATYAGSTVSGSCKARPTVEHFDPNVPPLVGAGLYKDFSFECYSKCKQDKCTEFRGSLTVTFGDPGVPPAKISWVFKPLELDECCVYNDCDVSIIAGQLANRP